MYSAIPPLNKAAVESGHIVRLTGGIYWNWVDADLRARIVRSSETAAALAARFRDVHDLLQALGGDLADEAPFYDVSQVGRILAEAADAGSDMGRLLDRLLFTEVTIVEGARKAGMAMGRFVNAAQPRPSKAIKALAEFGAEVTETFNKRLESVYVPNELRPLGPMILLEAARALGHQLDETSATARLDLIILADGSPALNGFVAGRMPPAGDVVRHERLVSIGART